MVNIKPTINKLLSVAILFSLAFALVNFSENSNNKVKVPVEKSEKLASDIETTEKTEDEKEENSLAALLDRKFFYSSNSQQLNFTQESYIIPLFINNTPFQPPKKLS